MTTETEALAVPKTEVQLFEEWLKQKQISNSSKKLYLYAVARFKKEVSAMTEEETNKWLVAHPRLYYRSALVHYFKFKGMQMSIVSIKEPPVERHEGVGRAELETMLEKIENKDVYWVFKLLFYTGARIAEILKLQLQDIDFTARLISMHPKGAETGRADVRVVKVPAIVMVELQKYLVEVKGVLGNHRCFFSDIDSSTEENIHDAYNRVLYYIEYSKTLTAEEKKVLKATHNFRRAMVNWILEKTGDIQGAKSFLGHKSIMTTQRYVDEMTEKKKRGAVEDAIEDEANKK